MKVKFDGFNWLVVLGKGELLVESLTKVVKQEKIGGAWLSGVGAAQWAELGFYDLHEQKYNFKKLDQLLEITNLQGNVAWSDGGPVLHIHGSFSDEKMQAFGGHVKELSVGGTCEILLHRWYAGELNRSKDSETGLNLLEL